MVQLVIGPRAPKRWFKGLEGGVGQIRTTFTVRNEADEVLVERGVSESGLIRSVTLTNVLVDTGSTTLCLPADLVAQLGLRFARHAVAEIATGHAPIRIFNDARIELMGRSGIFECIELPEGAPPLLGVMPLEGMGIEPNLRDEVLELRPEPYMRI
jgi:predicted aspartyl protease